MWQGCPHLPDSHVLKNMATDELFSAVPCTGTGLYRTQSNLTPVTTQTRNLQWFTRQSRLFGVNGHVRDQGVTIQFLGMGN